MNPQYIEACNTLNERFAIGAELIRIKNEIRLQSKLKEQYGTLYGYAETKFGLSPNLAKRTIAITKQFGETDDTGHFTGKIKHEYADFTMSQLVQMLYIPVKLRRQVTPYMTIEQIKTLSSSRKHDERVIHTESSDKNDNNSAKIKYPNPTDKTDELELHKIILDQALNKKHTSTEDKIMAGAQLSWMQENIKCLPPIYDNYENIAVYTECIYGIKKSTTYNMIAVAKRFCAKNNKGELTGKIEPEFEKFEWSQLIEMRELPQEMLEQITPDMSARDIQLMRTGKSAISKETVTVYKELHEIVKQLDQNGYKTLLDVAKRLKRMQDAEKAESE